MMSKRVKWFVVFGATITMLSFLLRSDETEAERVQRETEFASYVCGVVARNEVWRRPRVAIAMALHKGNNPFYAQYWDGLYRLRKLGVLQERSFQFLDTNGAAVRIVPGKLFRTNDVLWYVEDQTNGVYVVRARSEAMKAWEDLERQYATNVSHR
jgi:hypothetical protein